MVDESALRHPHERLIFVRLVVLNFSSWAQPSR
jgi:hypothetical protein